MFAHVGNEYIRIPEGLHGPELLDWSKAYIDEGALWVMVKTISAAGLNQCANRDTVKGRQGKRKAKGGRKGGSSTNETQ